MNRTLQTDKNFPIHSISEGCSNDPIKFISLVFFFFILGKFFHCLDRKSCRKELYTFSYDIEIKIKVLPNKIVNIRTMTIVWK